MQNQSRISVQINGKIETLQAGTTIYEIIKKYNIQNRNIAVAINGRIVTKNDYNKQVIQENSKIDIITAAGGG